MIFECIIGQIINIVDIVRQEVVNKLVVVASDSFQTAVYVVITWRFNVAFLEDLDDFSVSAVNCVDPN